LRYDEVLSNWGCADREDRGPRPIEPPRKTVLVDDLTLASLATSLNENPRGLLVRKDELSHWFASFDQFQKAQGADVSRWLSLHTGVLFAFDRKTDRESFRIFNPRVNICGGIQPKILKKCLTEEFFDRGLPARFLFACPPTTQDRWSESEIPDETRKAALNVFSQLFDLKPETKEGFEEPKVITLSPEAKEAFVEFYDLVGVTAVDSSEREEACWNKLTAYAARLALVGQLARGDTNMISGDVMQSATELAHWFGNEAARIYTTLAEDSETAELRRLAEFIERRGGTVTTKDIITNYRPLKNKTDLAEFQLDQLVAGGRGEWLPISTTAKGGRPTRRFRLHAQANTCLRLLNPQIPQEVIGIADADRVGIRGKLQDIATEAPVEPTPESVPVVSVREESAYV
jgi:hypothetical protein